VCCKSPHTTWAGSKAGLEGEDDEGEGIDVDVSAVRVVSRTGTVPRRDPHLITSRARSGFSVTKKEKKVMSTFEKFQATQKLEHALAVERIKKDTTWVEVKL
jgi:hypothetical protein